MDIAARSTPPACPPRPAHRASPRRPAAAWATAQAAACLAAACLTLPAAASEVASPDDAPGEALLFREIPSVFAASKFEQSASDAPASVSVLTAADIQRFGWRTLAEALGSLRGFYTGYDWAYDFVGVRGLQRPGDWNSRILLLVDGHQLNENVYNQAQLGRDAVVDIGAVERIEVVRGPGSSLYGGSAFFAVVNVITRRGRDFRGVEAYAHAGSFGERAFRVGAGDRRGSIECNLVASAMDRDGQRVIDFAQLAPAAPLAGRSVGADGERTHKLLGTLRAGDWSVQAAHAERGKTIPSGAYGTTLSDPRNFYDDTRQYVRVAYDGALGAATRARLAASADRYRYRADYRFVDGDYTNSDLATGSWARLEAAVDHRLSAATRLTAGLEHRRDRVRQFNYDVFAVNLDDRRHRSSGLYAQLEHALGASLRVNAGVRHDRYDIFGSATSPRLGLVWKPAPAPAHLLELTESGIIEDPERGLALLARLRALGVRLSIGDFGTGYSSFSHLTRLPVQTVKVDRSFVQGLPGSRSDAAVAEAISAMAKKLGLRTLAEGVETPEQLAALARMGYDEVQGYLLGRPMPAAAFEAACLAARGAGAAAGAYA